MPSNLIFVQICGFVMTKKGEFVRPWGVEPQSSEPESDILSIELRALSAWNSANLAFFL